MEGLVVAVDGADGVVDRLGGGRRFAQQPLGQQIGEHLLCRGLAVRAGLGSSSWS